jgi:uncharacterized protein YdhG (YjbR/CyaY superfamily)
VVRRQKPLLLAPMSVEDYLAALPESSRAALEDLRRAIRTAAPEAAETISYGMPAFKVDGRLLVSCAAFKRHCSVFPASQVVLDALGAELAPYLTGKATLRFPMDRPLPAALVDGIIKVRLEECTASHR